MKFKFLVSVIPFFFALPAFTSTNIWVSREVDAAIAEHFQQDPNAMQAVLKKFHYMKAQQLVKNDDIKWEANRKKYWQSLYCSHFVLGTSPEVREKVAKIRALFLKVDGMQNYDNDEITKLMSNRELRRRTFKDFDGIESKDKHKYCSFKLSKEFIEKRQKELTIFDSAAMGTASKFEFLHPKLRLVTEALLTSIAGGKEPTKKNYDDTMMTFITQLAPILETKAALEFLPKLQKACPGFVEKVWDKCRANKLYPAVFPSLSKQLCFEDRQSEAPASCKDIK